MPDFQIGSFDIADPSGAAIAVLGWKGAELGIYQRTQPAREVWHLTHLRTGGCPLCFGCSFGLAVAVAQQLETRFPESWQFGDFGKPRGATRKKGAPVFAWLERIGAFEDDSRDLPGGRKIFRPSPEALAELGIEVAP